MTTRVLQAFDTLDIHSKSTLDKLAKKNHHLTQVSTYGRSDTGLGLHDEFRVRKKPKENKEIMSHEQDLLYKRLRKSLAVTSSEKGSFRSKSVEAGSTGVTIHPEKQTANVKSSTGLSMCKGKEEVEISLLTLPKNPLTLWPCNRSPRRMTWSREVEKFPSLHDLTKVNRSKAIVGISLGDTDIWQWCSSSAYSEMDRSFKSTEPDESMNIQQLLENPDDTSTGTNLPHNKSVKEPVPLSFDDLLERKDVKVMTPRLKKVFLSQQKVSETYPVVYSTQQDHYEPFRSPGFHSLNSGPPIRKRSMHSAIILYTESLRAKYLIRKMREKKNGLHSHRRYTQPELKLKRTGVNGVNIGVLTAGGNVIGSPELSLPLHVNDESPSECKSTSIKKIFLLPKQKVSSPCVGPVINGMNPNQTCDLGQISPALCRPLPSSLRRGLSSRSRTSSQSLSGSSRSQTDFLSISRPMKCTQNGVIFREKQIHDGEWNKKIKETSQELKVEVTDCDTSNVHDRSCSRQSSDAKMTVSPQEIVVSDMVSTNVREKTHRRNSSSWQPETINIPTAN